MLTLEELPDNPSVWDFTRLDRGSLDRIPYELKKWCCQVKGCTNGTTVRDYGLTPWFFLDRNSKRSFAEPNQYWYNLSERYWMCGKHWKWYDRLEAKFGRRQTVDKLLDLVNPPIKKVIEVPALQQRTKRLQVLPQTVRTARQPFPEQTIE